MTIEKRYHQLIFSLPSEQPREEIAPQVAVHLPGKTVLPIRSLEIECEIKAVGSGEISGLRRAASRLHELVDLDAVHAPLVVRSRRSGDRFFPLGAPGSKTVADFLADEKVRPVQRHNVALLCDQLGPIWVVGYRIDDRVKLTTLTKRVLHLQARSISQ
jgi:tRNA(Ile)-lysidine synthetase-like protein